MAGILTRIESPVTLPSGVVLSVVQTKFLDPELRLSKNFVLRELANNKAKENIKAVLNPDVVEHIKMIQELRDRIGECNVTSWYRTESFNASCGGSKNSLHLKALATDIWFKKITICL